MAANTIPQLRHQEEDPIFPLPSVEKRFATIHRAQGKEDWCALIKGKGGHRFYPEEAWPGIRQLLEKA